jgi:hypothetical protein
MSKTGFVEYRGQNFWIYDVAKGVFLKHLIDAATEYTKKHDASWLDEVIKSWRVSAIVGELGISLGNDASDEQRSVLKDLIHQTCFRLSSIDGFSAEELHSWKILNGEGVHSRGAPFVATQPVIELGQAILMLLDEKLPKAPDGYWWFYGLPSGRSTIKMRNSD